MSTFRFLQKLALSLPEAIEAVHFEKTSFRVRKKIFATYDPKTKLACFKLSLVDQNVFSSINKEAIYPVPGKWGTHGYTYFRIAMLGNQLLSDALLTSYCEVAPSKLAKQIRPDKLG